MVAMTSAMVLTTVTMEMAITITRIGPATGMPIGLILVMGISGTRTGMEKSAWIVEGLNITLIREVVPMYYSSMLCMEPRGGGSKEFCSGLRL